MFSMSDAFDYLNKVYVLEKIDQNVFRVSLGLGDSRQQLVYVHLYPEKLHFFSAFGNDDDIDAAQAISATKEVIYGVKNMGGSWVLSDVVWMAGLHPHQIDNTLQGLAVTTDQVEHSFRDLDKL